MEPFAAETFAVLRAVEFCRSRGFENILLEGDTLQVVNSIKKSGITWNIHGQLVEGIKLVLQYCPDWQSKHTKREGNVAAHMLAKIGVQQESDIFG